LYGRRSEEPANGQRSDDEALYGRRGGEDSLLGSRPDSEAEALPQRRPDDEAGALPRRHGDGEAGALPRRNADDGARLMASEFGGSAESSGHANGFARHFRDSGIPAQREPEPEQAAATTD
jgi:hypothetical protein